MGLLSVIKKRILNTKERVLDIVAAIKGKPTSKDRKQKEQDIARDKLREWWREEKKNSEQEDRNYEKPPEDLIESAGYE